MNSILTSIAKMLGINEDDTYFDDELIIHINSVFSVLSQMGVGPGHFSITGRDETWSSFMSNLDDLEMLKQYVYLKVKIMFDPPASSSFAEAINTTIKELEWRMYSTTKYNSEVEHG